MGSLVDKMKKRVKESGQNKKEIMYFAPDTKRRIRFLHELDDGFDFSFHSHWNKGVNALCLEEVGEDCQYCNTGDDEMKTQTNYAFSVFDYDSNSTKILLYKVTGVTPLPALMEFAESYGSIMDRDYIISKKGKQQSASITVIPGEVSPFRNKKAKPYTKKQMLAILKEAFPVNSEDADDEDEEDEEEEKPAKKSGKVTAKGKGKGKEKQKKKKTLREKMEEIDEDDARVIAKSLGISTKEMKDLDMEELVDLMFEDYEEDDIQEAYEEIFEEEE